MLTLLCHLERIKFRNIWNSVYLLFAIQDTYVSITRKTQKFQEEINKELKKNRQIDTYITQ